MATAAGTTDEQVARALWGDTLYNLASGGTFDPAWPYWYTVGPGDPPEWGPEGTKLFKNPSWTTSWTALPDLLNKLQLRNIHWSIAYDNAPGGVVEWEAAITNQGNPVRNRISSAGDTPMGSPMAALCDAIRFQPVPQP